MKGFMSKLSNKSNLAKIQVKHILGNPAHRQSRLQQPITTAGMFQRPWKRVRRNTAPKALHVRARWNYKVYENIGENIRHKTSFIVVLDTGADFSFINQGNPHGCLKEDQETKPLRENPRQMSEIRYHLGNH